MDDRQHTKQILILSNRIRRVFHHSTGCKWTKMWILYYLLNADPNKIVLQKDIQQELEICAAAISDLLKQLEKDGLIIRADAQRDNRLKEIRLTQKAIALKDRISGQMGLLEQELTAGIEKDKLETGLEVIEKMIRNMETAEQRGKTAEFNKRASGDAHG